ncbi:NEL-type E3 ubiquitin ligase domain-containing protein [Pseudomonas sp. NPDC089392]|uniref:NEL-type E3 ubiquitin ligase domain-containing protein n=1 Tax=Pseudomonas sp. NPDC089392 TaxID=3364459 RepID=UPI00380CB90D
MPEAKVHPKLQQPADDFIVEQLPGWLKNASPEQLKSLRACMTAHLQSQKRMAAASRQLLALDRFAAQRLEQAMKEQIALEIDLSRALWHEERRRLSVVQGQVSEFESWFSTVPALQKLMQNFKEGESFFDGTALTDATTLPGEPQRVITQRIDDIVRLCRRTDVGRAYQDHLRQILSPDFRRLLATDKRLQLAVAVEIAAMKRQLAHNDLQILRRVAQAKRPDLPMHQELFMGALELLGHRVDGAIAFEQVGTPSGSSGLVYTPKRLLRVMLYLPDDSRQPLRSFSDWPSANRALAVAMADTRFRQAIGRRIALGGQADYQVTLGKRLQDSKPDLEPARVAESAELFEGLAAGHVQRIKADAAFIAVPTAQADAKAAAQRMRMLESAGLVLLNLAGLFVPAVGALLLADLARQVLGQVFEGASDWAQGHQHEALEHMLQVASTVVTGAAIAGGTLMLRSAFVEQLEPIVTEAGEQRLWHGDLQPYEQHGASPALTGLDNGLLSDGQAHWWRCDGVLYRVQRDAAGTWRLLHRDGPGAFGPTLENNGERAWRLTFGRPLEWQGADLLLKRLWPDAAGLEQERILQILTVADIDEAQLRGLLVEGRPLPVRLRDTLERFAADARVRGFFAQIGVTDADSEALQWCIDTLGLQGETLSEQVRSIQASAQWLRGPMLEHFAQAYLPADALLGVLKGSFTGLPDAYALDLLKNASVDIRQRMATGMRVPLGLAEQAREMLQQARLTRVRESLFLPDSYHADAVDLAFSLLRRRGLAPGRANLVLREHSSTGAVLVRLFPEQGGAEQVTVMVWNQGGFQLFDDMGRSREIELAQPQGLFQVLEACLPSAFLQQQGWVGEGAAERMRSAMQGWLPRGRLQLIHLLGWREARPVASVLQRLPDGRIGYPLSGRGASAGGHGQILRRRIRSLYPSFDGEAVERFLHVLVEHSNSAYASLLRQEQEYRRLDESLGRWTHAVAGEGRGHRRGVADAFRRAWRLEGEEVVYSNGEPGGLRLSIVGIPAGGLPDIPLGTDFNHVTDLAIVGLRLEALPGNFLRSFPELRRLDVSNNTLRALPDGIQWLPRLHHLRLARNRIRMTAASVQALAGLTHLHLLDLSNNPLGSISLYFNQLSRMRELYLYRSGLQVVPAGLEWCGLLEYADLRNNQIASLPQALLDAPLALRQVLQMEGNALSVADRERLYAAPPAHAHLQEDDASIQQARGAWLGTLAAAEQALAGERWDALRREPGHVQFFLLLAELTGGADFRLVREDLARRVWAMIDAANDSAQIREELFERATDPRTCVDSVAHCFSQLEVRMRVLQVTFGGDPLATRDARLLLAQRLFRLDQVERLASADYLARADEGRAVDEVEVSLAYRTGLASRLDLLGQPRTMQFRQIAGVTEAQLERAYRAVLTAEASGERTRYISQRDFWTPYLRARFAQEFAQVSETFNRQMDMLDEEKETLGSGLYVQRCEQLRRDTELAFEALALRRTQDELSAPLHGSLPPVP